LDAEVLAALSSGAQQQLMQLEQWAAAHGPGTATGREHAATAAKLETLSEQMTECMEARP
jgi:hypothetical protein